MARTHTQDKILTSENFWAQSLKFLTIFGTYSTSKFGSKTSYQVKKKLLVDTFFRDVMPRSLIHRYET
jgi:hypothetical protein